MKENKIQTWIWSNSRALSFNSRIARNILTCQYVLTSAERGSTVQNNFSLSRLRYAFRKAF